MYMLQMAKRKQEKRETVVNNDAKWYQKSCINNQEKKPKPFYFPEVYKQLIAIDYCQDVTNPHSMFQLDRTFTPLDWMFAELIE